MSDIADADGLSSDRENESTVSDARERGGWDRRTGSGNHVYVHVRDRSRTTTGGEP